MTSDSFSGKSYSNPIVSSQIISGTLYDRNLKPFSISIQKWDLVFNPNRTLPTEKEIEKLSEILNINMKTLSNDLNQQGMPYVIYFDIPFDKVSVIQKNIKTSSLYFSTNTIREYPASFHAAQAISELEKQYQKTLTPLPELNKNISYGTDIVTTLDMDIQYLLDLQIQQIFNNYKPTSIQGILQDIETNQILAISSYPWSNPENIENKIDTTIAFKEFNINPSDLILNNNSIPDITSGLYISEFPASNPKYRVAFSAKGQNEEIFFPEFEKELQKGLVSQGKLLN